MIAATLGVDLVPARRGWHALLWLVPLTALWIALNYAFPLIGASGATTVASRLAVHVLIALGLWWNSNTISHSFIHGPFFRSRRLKALFAI